MPKNIKKLKKNQKKKNTISTAKKNQKKKKTTKKSNVKKKIAKVKIHKTQKKNLSNKKTLRSKTQLKSSLTKQKTSKTEKVQKSETPSENLSKKTTPNKTDEAKITTQEKVAQTQATPQAENQLLPVPAKKNKEKKFDKSKTALPDEVYSSAKNDTMKVYMQEIGQISLVTKEQEIELAAKIHGDDPVAREQARTELIKANLRLVVKIAHDFKGLGLPLLDLISEGNIGLMRAVEKFDPAKGAKFSSYAAWWIKQSMRRALANQSKTIRIPVQSAGKINKIKNAKLKLMEKLNREPSDAEIAEFLEFSERTVSGLKLADLKTFSLHDPIQQGEDGEFQDIIPDRSATMPDRILGDRESIARLNSLLTNLDEREKRILRMRFGLDGSRPKTLEEVSQEIGRTRERVRQIQNQALAKLRNMLADETGVNFD